MHYCGIWRTHQLYLFSILKSKMANFLLFVIKKLLVVLILVCLCTYVLHQCYYRAGPVQQRKKMATAYFGKRINVVLGPSHSFYGINASMLGPGWINMAYNAQGFLEDKYILEWL